MPASAIPFIATVIGAFLLFILFVGGAAVWTSMPGPLHHDPEDGPIDDL